MNEIQQPILRSNLRRFLAKEFHILKRKWEWRGQSVKWASELSGSKLDVELIRHRSFIMRPLKDVEMYLQENKKTNLAIALEKLDGLLIKPGETFSFWKLVGRPTKQKGYLEGLVLKQGQIDKGIGGGLCQLGNLLFWIFAHSPLQILERHRHSFDVFPDVNRTIPFGAGATLSYNYIDLQVKNETDQSFSLHLWLDKAYLNGALLSEKDPDYQYELEERNHVMKQQKWGGYSRHNQLVQLQKKNGKVVKEKLLVENHALMMYNPFLKAGI